MRNILIFSTLFSLVTLLIGCDKTENEPMLVFKYTFDENQQRLDNFGNPSTVPAGNAAQTPNFKKLGVHSLELINTSLTIPSENTIIYKGAETDAGGDMAIDFDQELIVEDGAVLIEIPISSIQPGTYNFLRNSLGYQEYDIDVRFEDATFGTIDFVGSIASFIGYNTFITTHSLNNRDFVVNDDLLQGYFAFTADDPVPYTTTGNAPATTVVNPIPSSPIPAGSCLVTGPFTTPLTITGNETENIVVTVSVSINNSFEWDEVNEDGHYEPAAGETVVDMGVRGIIATTN